MQSLSPLGARSLKKRRRPLRSAPTLPPGFTASLFAQGLPTPRHIAVRENGDVYVTLRSRQAKFRATDDPGGVEALRDTDGDGVADVSARFGSPDIDTGLAIHDGQLYFSSMTTIFSVRLDRGRSLSRASTNAGSGKTASLWEREDLARLVDFLFGKERTDVFCDV